MKLIYATSIEYPSRLANRLQVVSMSKSFYKYLKGDFWLGGNNISKNLEFKIVNFYSKNAFVLASNYIFFCFCNGIEYIYSREEKILFFILILNYFFRLKLFIIYESHDFKDRPDLFLKFIYSKSHRIIVLNRFIKNEMVKFGVDSSKILIAGDAFDIDNFSNLPTKKECRKILGLNDNKKIVCYTGSLDYYHQWKGVDVLAKTSQLTDKDILYLFIGGKEKEVSSFRSRFCYDNLKIIGYIENEVIPLYLKSADVLVLPNKKGDKRSEFYTSPMKLFEYIASGTPIIASDLPSIREVVSENNVIFFKPNSVEDLSNKINLFFNNYYENKLKKISNLEIYTWDYRADKVISFLK